jgi:hypothetical protein
MYPSNYSLTTPETNGNPFSFRAGINTWETFQYVSGAVCMKGEDTGVWIREGRDPTKLAIYFQGGGDSCLNYCCLETYKMYDLGGCFNLLTCSASASEPTGFKNPDETPGYGGILDPDDSRNVLKDYSFVWIPYCTGDVYMGNKENKVPFVGSRKFFGRPNLNLFMRRLVPTFPDVTDLVITGESAGGFGAIASFDFIVQGWTSGLVNMTLIDDSGPILSDEYLAPCLQQQWRDLWGLSASMPPDCPQCSQPDGGGLVNVYQFLQNKYPDAAFGLIESANDSVISFFFGYGQENCTGKGALPFFEEGLRASETYFGPRFATMLFTGEKHTFTTEPSFYTDEHEGVMLYDWYALLVEQLSFLKLNPWGDSTADITHKLTNDTFARPQ